MIRSCLSGTFYKYQVLNNGLESAAVCKFKHGFNKVSVLGYVTALFCMIRRSCFLCILQGY